MKIDYDRGLIFWKRKAYPLSEVKTTVLNDHLDTAAPFEIHKGFKNGEIERKYAWDSIFFELRKNGLDGIMKKINPSITIKPPIKMPETEKQNEKQETKAPVKQPQKPEKAFTLFNDEKNVLKKHFEGVKAKLQDELVEVDKRLKRYR